MKELNIDFDEMKNVQQMYNDGLILIMDAWGMMLDIMAKAVTDSGAELQ